MRESIYMPTDRKERIAQLAAGYGRAPIGKTFGMSLSFDEHDQAVFSLPHNPGLEHALGDTHGGAIATMLDNATWFTAAVPYDVWIATVELTVRLLEPARKEELLATGRLIRAGKTMATAAAEVRSVSGRLVAIATGTFAVTTAEF